MLLCITENNENFILRKEDKEEFIRLMDNIDFNTVSWKEALKLDMSIPLFEVMVSTNICVV